MEIATLFHNPGSGDEAHSRKDLVSVIESNGYKCRYSSTKEKGWKEDEIDPDSDFIIVAGGDGTIRKVTELLLERTILDKQYPIGLLPLGTANNIARTLNLTDDMESIVAGWKSGNIRKFDVGRLYNVEDSKFFIESFGYGIFPYLMMEMKRRKKDSEEVPEKKLQMALELMIEIISSYKPHRCQLQVDGTDHSGTYLLAEVMNTKSIGPNLMLAPDSTPDDGLLEVVVLSEKDIDKFCTFISKIREGSNETYQFDTYKGKEVIISWEGSHVHVDDTVVKIDKSEEVRIEIIEGLLGFLVP